MGKKSSDKNPLNKLSQALDLPPSLSSNTAHIELMGNKEAIASGIGGIILYDENIIRLKQKNGEIKFCGEDLEIKSFGTSFAVICGRIISVEFL
jgi:sporulation protein YqfC